MYYDNGDSTEWRYVVNNSKFRTNLIYVNNIPDQTDVEIRCRTSDGYQLSNYSTTSTDLIINHSDIKFATLDLTDTRQKDVFTKTSYKSICKINESPNNFTIKTLFSDCNDDGLWDKKSQTPSGASIGELYFSCDHSSRGEYLITAGCVIEKLQNESVWTVPFCKGLGSDQQYCLYKEKYKQNIYAPFEVLS